MASPFLIAADVAPNHPQKERWKVAFRSMFIMGIKSQRFGAYSFSKFYYTLQIKPFATPRTVLYRGKKSLCDRSQFRTSVLPHRFIMIRPFRQHWISHNLLDMPRFQNFPEWIQNEKVAETCEFDGKEPLFVERTIAISIRVLGWKWSEYWSCYRPRRYSALRGRWDSKWSTAL